MLPRISLFQRSTARRAVRGFSLIEIAIVMIIISVIAALFGTGLSGAITARYYQQTRDNMDKVEAALINFVTNTKRLPCPADGSLAVTNAAAGVEVRPASGTCTNMNNGVVPWRSIGLTHSDISDGWNNRLTYRVPLHLTIDNGMTMSDCDPAGTNATVAPASPNHLCSGACTAGNMATCTLPSVFLTGKGLQIRNVAGTILADPAAVPPTGAAFVLISGGPTIGGVYSDQGTLLASTVTMGTEEAKNANNQALQAYYVESDLNNASTTLHFDDIVRRPSVTTIIGKANLGPRAH